MNRSYILAALLFCMVSCSFSGMACAAGPQSGEKAVSFVPVFGEEKLYVRMDLSAYPKEKPTLKAVIRLKPLHVDTNGDDFALAELTTKTFIKKKGEAFISFRDFLPAKYRACIDIFDRDEIIASQEETFEIPEKPIWLKERAGIEALSDDCVLPPFTPVETGAGDAVRVWNREYRIGAFCLPERIMTAGTSILTGSAGFKIEAGGKSLPLAREGKGTRLVRQAKGAVEFADMMKGGGLTVNSRARIEYDGLIINEIEIVPSKPVKVDRMVFYVPVKSLYSPYLLAGGNSRERAPGLPVNVDREYYKVIKGEGIQWQGPFKEVIWLGDDDLGVLWFCTTEEFWHPQEYAERPDAQQIVRSGGQTFLKVSFISRPKEINRPIKFKFGMIATPVRPRPEGWRGWQWTMQAGIFRIGLRQAYKGNMLIYWPSYPPSFWQKYGLSPLIRDKELYRKTAAADHAEGRAVLPYLAPQCTSGGIYKEGFSLNAQFGKGDFQTDDAVWIDKDKDFAIYGREWQLIPVLTAHGKRPEGGINAAHYVSQQGSFTDYMVWAMREHARCGADGIGDLDGGSMKDMNRLHGAGYYDDEGILRPTYTGLAQRDMNKRMLYNFIKERGSDRRGGPGLGMTHVHAMSAGRMYYDTFYDAGFKGEELNSGYWLTSQEYRDKIQKDKYYYANMLSLEQFRVQYTGKQWGWVPVMFSQLTKSPGLDKDWAGSIEAARDYLILPLLHDSLEHPSSCNPLPSYQTWVAKSKYGIADKDVEFLPFWKNERYVTSSNAEVKVSLYRKKGAIFAIVGNIAKISQEARVKFNLKEIGVVMNPKQIFDGVTDEALSLDDASLQIKLPPRDYKLIIIR